MEIIKDRSFELAEKYVQETGVSVFLTGKAGTGKTTFLKSIVEGSVKRCAVVAPTGVAAINAGGVTIHSFFQLPLCPYLPDVKELITEYQMPEKMTNLRKERIEIFRTLELLIIDEISMVRADILDAIDYMLRRYRRSDAPFGGVQLLMIGDVQQLPPVVTEAERKYFEQVYPSAFFFNSKALQKLTYLVIELQQVHRQSDATFVDILNDVRTGYPSQQSLDKLNSRYNPSFEPPKDVNWIRLTTHNAFADSVNTSKLAAIDSEEKSFQATVDGNFPENSYPAETELKLKVGAQVMFIRNDSKKGAYYNGKIGVVEALEPEIVVCDSEGNHIEVEPEEWVNIKYAINEETQEIEGTQDGVFVQLPLRLAWAITIHKSQGLTFDNVIIDAGQAFSFGQVYVALSRCRSLEGIVLASRITSSCTFANEEVNAFESSYCTLDQAEGNVSAFQKQYYIETLCQAFDLSELRYLYNRVNRVFQVEMPSTAASNAKQFKALSDPCLELTGDGGAPYAGLKDLKDTAEKFRAQIRYIAQSGDDAALRLRVAKGAAYFSDQLTYLAQRSVPLLSMEVKNKDTKKNFSEHGKEYAKELKFRLELYSKILVKGFELKEFLKMRTSAELNASSSFKTRIKQLKDIVG